MSRRNPNHFSPLFGINKLLLILRWCLGFPLRISGSDFNEFLFEPYLECARYLLYLFVFFASVFYVIYIIMKGHNYNNLVEAYKFYFESKGFTSFDTVVVNCLPYTNILASLFYLCSFRTEATRIGKICLLLTDVKKKIFVISERNGISLKYNCLSVSIKLVVRGIGMASLVQMAFAVAYFVSTHDGTLRSESITNVEKCLVSIAFLIYDLCWIYPPMVLSADLLICHLITELSATFWKWNTILKVQKRHIDHTKTNNLFISFNKTFENSVKERTKSSKITRAKEEECFFCGELFSSGMEETKIGDETKGGNVFNEEIISITLSLVDITRKTNKSFGGMLMNTYTNCLIICTTTLYVFSSLFINKYNGVAKFFIALACVSMTILSMIRLWHHTSAGQQLATGMRKCVHTLYKIQILKDTKISSDSTSILYNFLHENSHSPISPFSTFSLSNKTLLGVFATILTYLIVLIRFKACEDEDIWTNEGYSTHQCISNITETIQNCTCIDSIIP